MLLDVFGDGLAQTPTQALALISHQNERLLSKEDASKNGGVRLMFTCVWLLNFTIAAKRDGVCDKLNP